MCKASQPIQVQQQSVSGIGGGPQGCDKDVNKNWSWQWRSHPRQGITDCSETDANEGVRVHWFIWKNMLSCSQYLKLTNMLLHCTNVSNQNDLNSPQWITTIACCIQGYSSCQWGCQGIQSLVWGEITWISQVLEHCSKTGASGIAIPTVTPSG